MAEVNNINDNNACDKCSLKDKIESKHDMSGIELTEIERSFKRLRVNETNETNVPNNAANSAANNVSQSLPKSLCVEKRHVLNGYRRRSTVSSNRDKSNACKRLHNSEDDYKFGSNTSHLIKDFSDIVLSDVNKNDLTKSCATDSQSFNHYRTDNHLRECASNSIKIKLNNFEEKSCSQQAMRDNSSVDPSVDELAAYFGDNLYLPRKMSFMAEMMYT